MSSETALLSLAPERSEPEGHGCSRVGQERRDGRARFQHARHAARSFGKGNVTRRRRPNSIAGEEGSAKPSDSAVVPHVRPAPIGPPATPVSFDGTDERFIDFLVEEALKAWRTKTSKVSE
jgi:hypothetical protein